LKNISRKNTGFYRLHPKSNTAHWVAKVGTRLSSAGGTWWVDEQNTGDTPRAGWVPKENPKQKWMI